MKLLKSIVGLLKPGVVPIIPKRFRKFWLIILLALTLIFSLVFAHLNIFLSASLINIVLPALSIFTALIFTAIFTVPSQLTQKIAEYENDDDEPTVNFLITYRNFIQTFSRQLISMVLLCLFIIMVMVLNEICGILIWKSFFTAILCSLFLCFVCLFILVIRNINRMVEEHIKFSTKKIKEKRDRL